MFKRWWGFVLIAIMAAASPGCTNFPNLGNGSDNTGGDTVVAQFIPDDITLDIDELPDDDATSSKADNAAATITGRNAYDRATRTVGRVTHAFHRASKRAMALASRINRDMTSEDQTRVAGNFSVNGQSVLYLADFAAFDFDGDGNDDGSGTAVTSPVAIRIWVDRGEGFQRFMCALISQKPSETDGGAGSIYVRPVAARGTEFNDLAILAEWDRTDASHKWNKAWVTGQISDNYRFDNGRMRVDHRTVGDVTGKTVRATTKFAETPFGFDTFSVAGHWQRGGGAMLIAAQASGGVTQLSFDEICVSLTDRDATDAGLCDDFDTQDMTPLDAADGTETDWPDAFPEAPTFEATDVVDTQTTTQTTQS